MSYFWDAVVPSASTPLDAGTIGANEFATRSAEGARMTPATAVRGERR
jgi:hypothetical protein